MSDQEPANPEATPPRAAQRIPWGRLALEGLVISVSILLAFAVDAWWDQRKAMQAELDQLDRVSVELKANVERLNTKLETLAGSIEATSTVISWMGPTPDPVSLEDFIEQQDRMVRIGMLSLPRLALEDYLAAGETNAAGAAEVRDALTDLLISQEEFIKHFDLLREHHADYLAYQATLIPSLPTMKASPWMADHPTSRFPLDPSLILSDLQAQNLYAQYLIRMEIIRVDADDLLNQQAEVLEIIEAFVAR